MPHMDFAIDETKRYLSGSGSKRPIGKHVFGIYGQHPRRLNAVAPQRFMGGPHYGNRRFYLASHGSLVFRLFLALRHVATGHLKTMLGQTPSVP